MSFRYSSALTVLPFIVAPRGVLQQGLVIAPTGIVREPEGFVNLLSRFTTDDRPVNPFVFQRHRWGRYVVLSLTIQTAAVETFSGRRSMNVCFGAFVPVNYQTHDLASRVQRAWESYFSRQFGVPLTLDNATAAVQQSEDVPDVWGPRELLASFENEFEFVTSHGSLTLRSLVATLTGVVGGRRPWMRSFTSIDWVRTCVRDLDRSGHHFATGKEHGGPAAPEMAPATIAASLLTAAVAMLTVILLPLSIASAFGRTIILATIVSLAVGFLFVLAGVALRRRYTFYDRCAAAAGIAAFLYVVGLTYLVFSRH